MLLFFLSEVMGYLKQLYIDALINHKTFLKPLFNKGVNVYY